MLACFFFNKLHRYGNVSICGNDVDCKVDVGQRFVMERDGDKRTHKPRDTLTEGLMQRYVAGAIHSMKKLIRKPV